MRDLQCKEKRREYEDKTEEKNKEQRERPINVNCGMDTKDDDERRREKKIQRVEETKLRK